MKGGIMKRNYTEEELIAFEQYVTNLFELGKIPAPVHLSGGNETQLISIMEGVQNDDYVLAGHRNHYHYLLKGGDPHKLIEELQGRKSGLCRGRGKSMHLYDKSINFYTSGIVGGMCAIGVGIALGLKKQKSKAHVWCFVGDGAEDTGHFAEASRFGLARALPLTFVVEDNDLAVESTKELRWHNHCSIRARNIVGYDYERKWPHVGIGKHVSM